MKSEVAPTESACTKLLKFCLLEIGEHMIFGPKINLRSDPFHKIFLGEHAPSPPPRYYMWSVDFGHTALKLHAMALHTLQHAILYKSFFTFIRSMQMGEYIIEAPRMPWSWCSSYSMVAKNLVSETT